ncbi:MAG TPA: FHA domain-containing protein, partial [Polyangiaceae bacterium]|nr:FHA domain-containing protein [Polyangiaceae bacterium]
MRLPFVARMYVARFRLRFLLQELDLIGPVVTLGRSSECQITLDDPLVSRVHAQLTITDSDVRVRDLGSRNGVRVNERLIDGDVPLRHLDRLRLGTQDLVFLAVGEGAEAVRLPRATGSMAHCHHCGRPFPGESAGCPHCGTPAPFSANTGPDTITAVEPHPSGWTVRLIAEVIERALAAGRLPEAERMLERCSRDLEARQRSGGQLAHEQLTDAAR